VGAVDTAHPTGTNLLIDKEFVPASLGARLAYEDPLILESID